MLRRSFLKLLAAVPFVGKVIQPEPDLNALLEEAISRHTFVPPLHGCAEPPKGWHKLGMIAKPNKVIEFYVDDELYIAEGESAMDGQTIIPAR